MKLLIVDDQKSVVDTLKVKIDWKELGIESVYGAYSAAQARVLLTQHAIDVVLCDIEMPIEDGLSLLKWMRQMGMETRCILLTAHAEFSYAQKSLSLGAFEYVLQPAPFVEIRASVERAIQDILTERGQQFETKYEQVAEWKKDHAVAEILWKYLDGGDNYAAVERCSKEGLLPATDCGLFLIKLDILSWSISEIWETSLLAMMVDNAVDQVFAPYGQSTLLFSASEESFLLILWSETRPLSCEIVTHQLSFLYNICLQRLKCTIACYQEGPMVLPQLRAVWKRMTRSGGAAAPVKTPPAVHEEFQTDPAPGAERFHFAPVCRWVDLLQQADFDAVREEAAALARDLQSDPSSGEPPLRKLYEDYIKAVESVGGKGLWQSILVDTHSYDIFCNGAESPADFSALVDLTLEFFRHKGMQNDQDIVEQVKRYVEQNLEREISCSDIAGQVFLNQDYLNRIFKKRTGYTLKSYVFHCRMDKAKLLLQMTRLPISIIAAKVGYSNFSHFSASFKKAMGVSPIEARQAGALNEEK